MNYATDRLDRLSRNREGIKGLWCDYNDALARASHSMLGRTLCAVGWNRHAVYHFSRAFETKPDPETIGDYAQMAELAGWPEVGVIALVAYHFRGGKGAPESSDVDEICNDRLKMSREKKETSWLMQAEPLGGCGCGNHACGASVCTFPEMLRPFVSKVLLSIDEFLAQQLPTSMWSAHEIHRRNMNFLPLEKTQAWTESIPQPLRFWETDGNLTPVLRMLLVKLLYLTIPRLACAALVALEARNHNDDANKRNLTKVYKSHAAFYTFIRYLVLGDRRIKPIRRHSVPYYHVPIWDLLHRLDQRCDYCFGAFDDSMCNTHQENIESSQVTLGTQWKEMLMKLSSAQRQGDTSTPLSLTWAPLLSSTGCSPQFLFVVGDSHVLSLAWQTVQLPIPIIDGGLSQQPNETCDTERRLVRFTVVPVLVTGLKAWHCRKETRFFTRTRLLTTLERLPPQCKTIVFSAGEIDAREGLGGPRLEGYTASCLDVIPSTVSEYVKALQELLEDVPKLQQILVLPVAPHASQSTSRLLGQFSRRETMREWNHHLRLLLKQMPSRGLYFVDYVDQLLDGGGGVAPYVLRSDLAADSTHMNGAFAKHFEQAIVDSGCSISQILL